MADDIQSLLNNEFTSAEDVINVLSAFENICLKTGDLRGVFATAYLHITRNISGAIENNEFINTKWSEEYLIRFANLYREAIINYETGQNLKIAKSWQISFDLAKENSGLIIQHLMLGINAHINHDLAIALYDVSIDPERQNKHKDHYHVNSILERATGTMKKEVMDKYAPILSRLDRATGNISDNIANFSIPKARDHAWSFAIALTLAKTDQEQNVIRKALDEQAAVLARLILVSPTRDPRLIKSVSSLKRLDNILSSFIRLFRKER